jgi:hypothetical protein
MAKKAKKEIIVDPILFDEDLLGNSVAEEGVTFEQIKKAVEKNEAKVFLGYHPITGAEVWSK